MNVFEREMRLGFIGDLTVTYLFICLHAGGVREGREKQRSRNNPKMDGRPAQPYQHGQPLLQTNQRIQFSQLAVVVRSAHVGRREPDG